MHNKLNTKISLPTMANTKILIKISRQLIKQVTIQKKKKKPNHLTAVVVVGLKLLLLQPEHPMKLHQWRAPLSEQDHEEDPGGS